MRGFSKHKSSEFNAYNIQAFNRIQAVNPDSNRTAYTYCFPNIDPTYCWAREEEVFTSIMTPKELLTVVTRQEAIDQGMRVE